MYYYDTPNYSVALNAKVASSSMARAIIRRFCPKQDWMIRTAAFPPGVTANDRQWHWLAPGKLTPDKPVVLLVRDPVDRFITACQQIGLRRADVNAAIASLVSDAPMQRTKPADVTAEEWSQRHERRQEREARVTARRQRRLAKGLPVGPERRPGHLRDDVHFFHQHQYAVGPTHCFRFPRDIAAAAEFVGITGPLPKANEAKREKPTLTSPQAAAVRAYYAADQALFDAITEPGYVYTPDE